jgi:hypothetical protein
MLRTSNSPTPLLQEETQIGKHLAASAEPVKQQQQKPAAKSQQQGQATKRRPAPLRILRTPAVARSSAPLVVVDDSKPELGDLGLGLHCSTLLRLPGMPA